MFKEMDITNRQVQINLIASILGLLFFKNQHLHKLNIHVVFLCTQNFK